VAGSLRRAAVRAAAPVLRTWRPYSRVFLVGEGAGWVIDEEMRAVGRIAAGLGVRVGDPRLLGAARRQAVFYGSQFALLGGPWRPSTHRLATAYFHGRPGTPGMPEFDATYEALRAHHRELQRVQVSHREMHEIVLASGIDPAKVFRIPIGIEPTYFTPQTPELRRAAREELGLPQEAFVVGSFQKDGTGWGDGLEPKLIKGPDVLVEALVLARARVPELHVLLSGPARGYVKDGLDRHAIPYVHRQVDRYEDVAALYRPLDAYVVSSRQEGGPKGVLEAMAAGVPLVSTAVGQATDLVRSGENGWLVEVEDAEALAARLADVAARPDGLERVVAGGLETARANSYSAQAPLWDAFFDGFVDRS
jgi:glycosyltransferase involved in cell wall biosynthesis